MDTFDDYPKPTRSFLLVLVGAGIFVLIWITRDVFLLFLAAVLLALILDFPIRFLTLRGVKRPLATAIVLFTLLTLLVVLNIFLLPTLLRQTDLLISETLPSALEQTAAWIEAQDFSDGATVLGFDMPGTGDWFDQFGTQVGTLVEGITQIVPTFFGGILSTILTIFILIFLVVFLLARPESYHDGLLLLLPPRFHQDAAKILQRLDAMLRQWVQVTFISMLFMGLVAGVGFAILGINEALVLGLIAGSSSFIPNFGPLFVLVPLLAATISDPDVNLVGAIVVLYGATFLQNQILLPVLMSEQVKIPAAMVLIGQILAGILFGFLGLLLAVPLLVILMVLVQEVYVRRILNNETMTVY